MDLVGIQQKRNISRRFDDFDDHFQEKFIQA